MDDENRWYETIAMPALLRHAWAAYGSSMRAALVEAGYDDIPRNGLYVIGGLALGAPDVPLGQLVKDLRISKQSAGQLVDRLVMRGYLERAVDRTDRRKLTVALTERGRGAAEVQAAARAKIDAALAAAVGQRAVDVSRRTLATIVSLARSQEDEAAR